MTASNDGRPQDSDPQPAMKPLQVIRMHISADHIPSDEPAYDVTVDRLPREPDQSDDQGVKDVPILLPSDEGCSAWNLGKELTNPGAIVEFSETLIPDVTGDANPFFTEAARELMKGVMSSFNSTHPGRWEKDERAQDSDLLMRRNGTQRSAGPVPVPSRTDRSPWGGHHRFSGNSLFSPRSC